MLTSSGVPRSSFVWSHLSTTYMISLIALTHMLALDALLYENQYYGINLESMAFHLVLAVCTNVIYGGFSFCMCIYFPGQELMAILLVFIMMMLKVGLHISLWDRVSQRHPL